MSTQQQGQNRGNNRQDMPRPRQENNMPATISASELALPGGRSFMPTPAQWSQIKEMGAAAHRSGMLPSAIKNAEAAAIVGLKAFELGIPLMEGFAHIHVINGKPTISRELMQTLVTQNIKGAVIDYVELRDTKTGEFLGFRAEGQRPGRKPASWTFTLDDARKAKLLNKPGPWQEYPQAMCLNRAISALCRAYFPDGLRGCSYTPEELEPAIPTTGRHLGNAPAEVDHKPEPKDVDNEPVILPPENNPAPEDTSDAEKTQSTATDEPPPHSEAEAAAEKETQPDANQKRLDALGAVVDPAKWPKGTVLKYAQATFKGMTSLGDLSDQHWQLLVNVVKNSDAVTALGEFTTSDGVRV